MTDGIPHPETALNAPEAQISEAKTALRKRMRTLRADAFNQADGASDGLKAQVLKHLCDLEGLKTDALKTDGAKTGLVVAGYVSIHAELDPEPTLEALEALGASLALPVTGEPGEPLIFRAWRSGEPLAMGRFGTFEPTPDALQVDPDVVLVPLLAFDGQGNRLGFGGGYYDRTLSALRAVKKIATYGIAFDAQQVEAVPTNALDERLDGVFTESRFVAAARSAQK